MSERKATFIFIPDSSEKQSIIETGEVTTIEIVQYLKMLTQFFSQRAVEEAENELFQSLNRQPTDKEIEDHLDLTIKLNTDFRKEG